MAANAPDRHRPASHPVVQRLALRVLADDLDDLIVSRGSVIDQLREERDPPLPNGGDEALIDQLALITAALRPPLTVGQRSALRVITAELVRLSEDPA